MHSSSTEAGLSRSGLKDVFTFGRVIWLFIALILLRALLGWSALPERVATGDNDDFLRMVMVRDWMAGQSWFDTQQYRLLPPEGVSIHWSRYIDAGIGSIVWLASLFVSPQVAELVALLLWPTLLMCVLLVVNGLATRQISGGLAGIGAMFAVAFWTKLAGFEFSPGRVDHHNVQILSTTVVAFALVWPAKDRRSRCIAAIGGGFAMAFSLAVGLEMLPLLLLVWAVAGLRFVFDREGAGLWLAVFALTLSLAVPLLTAGQLPVSAWAIRYCDAVAPPLMSLLAVGVVVSLVPVALAGRLRNPATRFGLMSALLGLGLWLAWPLLGPCLAGPYGAMSPEARAVITERIGEAQPALSVFMERGRSFDFLMLYLIGIVIVASLLALRASKRLQSAEGLAVVLMLLIGWMGVLAAFGQIRASTLGAPAIPFLTGFVLREVVGEKGFRRGPALAAVLGIALMSAPMQIMAPLRSAAANATGEAVVSNGLIPSSSASASLRCRDGAAMARLDALPPSILATTTGLGMPVLYYTRHSVTAAPYHRSGDAFWNGEDPFRSEDQMLKMLRKTKADYLVLCKTEVYSASKMNFAAEVMEGNVPPWLEPVEFAEDGNTGGFYVLRVINPLPGEVP